MNPESLRHLPQDLAARQIPEYLDLVGPGWHGILMRTHTELIAVLPNYQVSQIKEKWGALCIYLSPYIDPVTGEIGITSELGDRVGAIVRAAEDESRRTARSAACRAARLVRGGSRHSVPNTPGAGDASTEPCSNG